MMNKESGISNKAAEEGELPAALEAIANQWDGCQYDDIGGAIDIGDSLRREFSKVAADRASRQVANKAEVESVGIEVLQLALHALKKATELRALGFNELHASDCKDGIDSAGCTTKDYAKAAEDIHAIIEKARKAVRGLLATPPATTGASTALRPTDDDLWDATLRDRDAYHEWADKLADAIATHFGVDIGEHSNQNLPWDEALQAIENAEPVGASTVLTDERIKTLFLENGFTVKEGLDDLKPYVYAAARAIEREVAAQAGQVAVPDFRNVTAVKRMSDQGLHLRFTSARACSEFEQAAAPSPAKESK